MAINAWVADHLPDRHPHLETVGTLIDQLAASQAWAWHLLMTTDPTSPRVHTAFTHLAQHANRYTALTSAITTNRSADHHRFPHAS